MKLDPKLIAGRFVRRYKRFFADVEIVGGAGSELVTAHCPNTGSMKHCLVEGSECWISRSDNPKRKLTYTLESVSAEFGGMAGVNTSRTNKLVKEALLARTIPELSDYAAIQSEVKFGQQSSRLDFHLSNDQEQCWVEVKNVTMGLEGGVGAFPDAVTERGRKHLYELAYALEQGHRAVLFYCVQHTDISRIRPAWEIDPAYCETLKEVMDKGVEILVYGVSMTRSAFKIAHKLPFVLD